MRTASTPPTTTVRLRPAERLAVEAAAALRGVGPSSYLHLVAIEAARRDIASAAIGRLDRDTDAAR